ncbi:hypothetical protein VaNZ11_008481 [Volvox africanus]|uniref:Chitin-binding type-2 domain-containing protein n=1 Tax=Volvox africanus TaxID=51714 RepID=A0ABQ5S580_9CHLO|nr:hypothetical protein VaNZ11_008481 [Volvox africanus]
MAKLHIPPFLLILSKVLVTIAAAGDDSDTAVASTTTTTSTVTDLYFRHGKLSIILPPKPTPLPVTCPISSSWCIDKPNDVYANPCECSSFIKCVNGRITFMRCPFHLVFNPSGKFCDWVPNVSNCYPRGPSPPRPKPSPPRQPSPSPKPRPLPSPPPRKLSLPLPKPSLVRTPPRVKGSVKSSPVKPGPKLPSPAPSVPKPPATLEP